MDAVEIIASALQADLPYDVGHARRGGQVVGSVWKWKYGDRPQSSVLIHYPTCQHATPCEPSCTSRITRWRVASWDDRMVEHFDEKRGRWY